MAQQRAVVLTDTEPDLEFRDLALEDRELFEGIFKRYPRGISEHTFTNLFMWCDS